MSLSDDIGYNFILNRINEVIDQMGGEISTFIGLRQQHPTPADCARERHDALYTEFTYLSTLLRKIEHEHKAQPHTTGATQ